jgi:hypothetical protein
MPVAVAIPTTQEHQDPISELKANLASTSLSSTSAGAFDIRSYAHFDSTPSIGTEFRDYAKDGKPVLSIREILGDEVRLKALGRLV